MKKHLLLPLFFISTTIFAQNSAKPDSILLTINEHNTILVQAIFNKIDTLNLNFDTGTTELTLTNDVIKNKLKSSIKLYNTQYSLQIGNTNYQTKVYDAQLTGHGTDGRFGWDLFKNKIVEINYDKNLLVIHATLPQSVANSKKFAKLKIEPFKDLFLVSSEIKQSGVKNNNLFLFDTGFQRTAMLDADLLRQEKFPIENMSVIKKMMMKGAQGNEIPVITVNLPTLSIGKYKLKNVPVQITTANKPFKNKNIHILGNEVLKRFNTFIDFQHNLVYLKANDLYHEKYIDQKKKDG